MPSRVSSVRFGVLRPWLGRLALLTAMACKGTVAPLGSAEQAALVASVEVFPPAISLAIGDTLRLTATPKDSAGNVVSGVEVAWTSSDSTVAGGDRSGLVNAKEEGAADITATSWAASATVSASVADTTTPPPPPPPPPPGQTDEPVFDAANSNHVSLFYDDFSSYALGTATTLFDGSGAHKYSYRAGPYPAGYPEDPRRTIMDGADPGGGQEGSVIGGKYLRLDYTAAGPQAMYVIGDVDQTGASEWKSIIITFYVRNVGTVFYSKMFEVYTANGRLWTLHFDRPNSAPGFSCVWNSNGTALEPAITPRHYWGPNLATGGPGYYMTNMGGPSWQLNTFGVPSHPYEGDNNGSTSATPSSSEWHRYTIRYTRDLTGSGTGRYEMWLWGTNPHGEGRRLTSVRIMDWNGAEGSCAADSVTTSVRVGANIIKTIEIGNTTSGNSWNEDAPYDKGAYIDFDAIRVWTIR